MRGRSRSSLFHSITMTGHVSLRVSLLGLAVALFGGHRACAQETKPAPAAEVVAAKAKEYLDAQVAANGFSGAVLVAKGDQVLVARGCGMANVEHQVANTPG